MTDLNNIIMEKSQGNAKLNPDEQRKFLETFEERVIAYCSISDANSSLLKQHFKEIVEKITESYQPVTVKISPEVISSQQVFYMILIRTKTDKGGLQPMTKKNSFSIMWLKRAHRFAMLL